MRRLLALLALACLALAGAAAPPADGAAKKRRAVVVCFKKTVVKDGRRVRRTVCRAKRRVKRRAAQAPVTGSVPVTPPPPAPVAPVLPPPPAPPVTGSDPVTHDDEDEDEPPCEAEDTEWLTVTAYDLDQRFRLRFSRTCLRAGRTIVQYRNDDAQEHNLEVEGVSPSRPSQVVVGSAQGGEMEQADVQLAEGEWRFYCSIAGHESMTRTVTVTSG
jgi:plastocyanin